MTNTNSHQNTALARPSQPHTVIEQILSTQRLVHSAGYTNGKHSAWSTRISPLDAADGISRPSSRQPADQIGEWIPRTTHIRLSEPNRQPDPHQRQVVTLMQLNSHRHNEYRPDTSRPGIGSKTYTSGPTSGRGEEPTDPDTSRKAFTHAKRPPRGVRQDKGVLTNAASASVQPAPDTKSIRVQFTNNRVVRSQNHSGGKQKAGRLTLWGINHAVYSELERIAAQERLSLSQVGKTALDEWIHQRLHDRHEALLYPVLRQLIRDELKAFGNRLVFFLIRIAFAAEQSRILITNVLHRMFIQMGIPNDKFNDLVDKSNKLARRNTIARSPEIKTLMQEWEASHEDDKKATHGKENKHQ